MSAYFPYSLLHSLRNLPSRLAISCPRCRCEAGLQFPYLNCWWAEVDRRFAENLPLRPFTLMSVEEMQQRVASGELHGVIEWDGIHTVLARFPQIFPLDWQPPTYQLNTGWGMCICALCGYFQRYEVRWPEDGYYTFKMHEDAHGTFRENVVWAYTRRHAIALHDYLASEGRDARAYPPYEDFLQHIPKVFLRAKNRNIIVRRLDQLLHG